MNIRCLIGLHRWAPRHTLVQVGAFLQMPLSVAASVRLSADGKLVIVDHGHVCVRCDKRKPL